MQNNTVKGVVKKSKLSNIANLREEDEQLIKFDSTFDELKDFDGENLLGRADT